MNEIKKEREFRVRHTSSIYLVCTVQLLIPLYNFRQRLHVNTKFVTKDQICNIL